MRALSDRAEKIVDDVIKDFAVFAEFEDSLQGIEE
jgi:hypothetical protein